MPISKERMKLYPAPTAWVQNPWVVAYTFSVIGQNIDQIGRAAA